MLEQMKTLESLGNPVLATILPAGAVDATLRLTADPLSTVSAFNGMLDDRLWGEELEDVGQAVEGDSDAEE